MKAAPASLGLNLVFSAKGSQLLLTTRNPPAGNLDGVFPAWLASKSQADAPGAGLGAAAAQHLCKPGLQFKHVSMDLGVPAAKLARWETCGGLQQCLASEDHSVVLDAMLGRC